MGSIVSCNQPWESVKPGVNTVPLIRESKGWIPLMKSSQKSKTSCKFVFLVEDREASREYKPIHCIKKKKLEGDRINPKCWSM